MTAPSRTDFWGVELNAKKKEAVWDAVEGIDDDARDPDIMHTLHIQRVILGANAKDENNLVMITAENLNGEEITHPLCWLSRKSVTESQCSMHMAVPPPVTLQLAQGSGPVHIIGIWEQQLEEDLDGSSIEENERMMNDAINYIGRTSAKDVETTKQKKRPASSPPPKAAKVAKKKTTVAESDSEEEDDENKDSEQEEKSDEDEESDFNEDSEEESESEEDEPAPPPKKKSQQGKATTPKQKGTATTPKSIGDKSKKPSKGVPSQSPSLEELRAKIAKSPHVPKKRGKFNKYLQNNFKVVDQDVKNKLWNFAQQNKH